MTLFTPASLTSIGSGDPFLSLHREMNRLFDDVLRGGYGQTWRPSDALLAPQMDVSEKEGEVRIQAELPGVKEEDIEVSMEGDVLTIRAEKQQEHQEDRGGVHLSERSYGTFQRTLRLPFAASQDEVKATFENGVLSVTLPRPQGQERSRRIPVSSAGQRITKEQETDGTSRGTGEQKRAKKMQGEKPTPH